MVPQRSRGGSGEIRKKRGKRKKEKRRRRRGKLKTKDQREDREKQEETTLRERGHLHKKHPTHTHKNTKGPPCIMDHAWILKKHRTGADSAMDSALWLWLW